MTDYVHFAEEVDEHVDDEAYEVQKRQRGSMKIRPVEKNDDSRGKAMTDGERRQIMHLLDIADSQGKEAKADPKKRMYDYRYTYKEIAALTGKHVNTIAKMKKERDRQQCVRIMDGTAVRTLEVPQPKARGGHRWSRMNDEQSRMCTRIAVENPRLTAAQIRERMQTEYPDLTLCDSTVLRALHSSNLQFLRAKMRDPRSEGTPAHAAEKRAFLHEQKKGATGALGAEDLFFMDETTVYLNLTTRRAWGTADSPAEIKHAKGKTMTIGVYAGLGLVSKTYDTAAWNNSTSSAPAPTKLTDPRGNNFVRDEDGAWRRARAAPRFMLFWWLRPPTRKNSTLPRFLDLDDILDPVFKLQFAGISELRPAEWDKNDEKDYTEWNKFFFLKFDDPNLNLEERLLLHGIEYRQVDQAGELINVSTKNKRPTHVSVSSVQMRAYLRALQSLTARAILTIIPSKEANDAQHSQFVELLQNSASAESMKIPRHFFTPNGRNTLGGTRQSERGDQSLFMNFLQKHVNYVADSFPPDVRDNLRDAWDSAAQHGKTDVTKNTKSFIHEWVERKLKIKGAIFLPVREPDFNPVELLFAFVKGVIRRRFPKFTGEVDVETMVSLIDEAFQEVTEDMVKGWLRYGCYVIPNDAPETLRLNRRCEYDEAVDVSSYWEALLSRYASHLTPHARAKFLAHDYAYMESYVAEASVDAPAELVQLVQVKKNDATGFKVLHAFLRDANIEHLDAFHRHFIGGDGTLLGTLDKAKETAKTIATPLRKTLTGAGDDVEMLLDAQERIFHPKLDHTVVVELVAPLAPLTTETIQFKRKTPLRHRFAPSVYTLPWKTVRGINGGGEQYREGHVFQIREITAKAVTLLAVDGGVIQIPNARVYNAAEDVGSADSADTKKAADRIRRDLALTPYEKCIVQDEPNWEYVAAVVALKAYEFERTRMDDLAKNVVREFAQRCGRYETPTSTMQNAAVSIFETAMRAWERLTPDGRASHKVSEQPPLYVVTNLRAERRASLQLKILARDDKERRWPGYPESERNERDNVAIREVQPNERVSLESRPIRKINIHKIYKSGSNEYVDATITFEDGAEEKLIPEYLPETEFHNRRLTAGSQGPKSGAFLLSDETGVQNLNAYKYEEKIARLFGNFSEHNQHMFDMAKSRYKEEKDKSNGGVDRELAKRKVVGVYRLQPLHKIQNAFLNTTEELNTHLVYDATRNHFYPPIHKSVDDARAWLRAHKGKPVVLGLADDAVLTNMQLPKYVKATDEIDKAIKATKHWKKLAERSFVIQRSAGDAIEVVAWKKLTPLPSELIDEKDIKNYPFKYLNMQVSEKPNGECLVRSLDDKTLDGAEISVSPKELARTTKSMSLAQARLGLIEKVKQVQNYKRRAVTH